jgi:hypothetical protein
MCPPGFSDIACRRHGVGLVVSALDPPFAALSMSNPEDERRSSALDLFFLLIVELGWIDPLFGQEAVDLGFKSVVALP